MLVPQAVLQGLETQARAQNLPWLRDNLQTVETYATKSKDTAFELGGVAISTPRTESKLQLHSAVSPRMSIQFGRP